MIVIYCDLYAMINNVESEHLTKQWVADESKRDFVWDIEIHEYNIITLLWSRAEKVLERTRTAME